MSKRKSKHTDSLRIYPCAVKGCKVMRSKDEGGTTFTVCDKHWNEHFKKQTHQRTPNA